MAANLVRAFWLAVSIVLARGKGSGVSEREPEREEFVEPETPVLEGDDQVPRQPAPPLDPFTPEPGPRPGERRAFRVMRLAWVVIAIVVAALVYLALR